MTLRCVGLRFNRITTFQDQAQYTSPTRNWECKAPPRTTPRGNGREWTSTMGTRCEAENATGSPQWTAGRGEIRESTSRAIITTSRRLNNNTTATAASRPSIENNMVESTDRRYTAHRSSRGSVDAEEAATTAVAAAGMELQTTTTITTSSNNITTDERALSGMNPRRRRLGTTRTINSHRHSISISNENSNSTTISSPSSSSTSSNFTRENSSRWSKMAQDEPVATTATVVDDSPTRTPPVGILGNGRERCQRTNINNTTGTTINGQRTARTTRSVAWSPTVPKAR